MGNMAYIAHLVDTEDLKELSEMVGTEYAEKLINEYKKKEENNDSSKNK